MNTCLHNINDIDKIRVIIDEFGKERLICNNCQISPGTILWGDHHDYDEDKDCILPDIYYIFKNLKEGVEMK